MDEYSLVELRRYIERLAELYWADVCTYARGIARNSEDAEDLTQEAYERTFIYLRDHPPMQIRSPKKWLCKTVKNCYLNRRRGMLQYSTESLEQIKLSSAEEDLPFGEIPDCSENQPERVVEYNEEVKRVREQIAEIPTTKDARETLALYLLGELSRSEIARESGKSIGTVKNHVRHGLGELRVRLAGMERQKE